MSSARPSKRAVAKAADEEFVNVPWLELSFVACLVVLILQVFPGAWWGIVGALETVWEAVFAIIDVRQWTWKVYASLSTLAIVVLVGIKAWVNR